MAESSSKNPPSIMDQLRKINPKADDIGLVTTAVHQLKTPKDIIGFVGEYVDVIGNALKKDGEDDFNETLRIARMNIGYALGYLTPQEASVWQHTLRDANILVGPGAAIIGMRRGSVIDYNSPEELQDKLKKLLSDGSEKNN